MPPFFFCPILKIYTIDTDKEKPVEEVVAVLEEKTVLETATCPRIYDVKKDHNGKRIVVAHRNKKNKGGVETADNKKEIKEIMKEGNEKEKQNVSKPETVVMKSNDEAWLPEEDEKLKVMKADGKSTWVMIATALGRSKHNCQARFKELNNSGNAVKEDAKTEGIANDKEDAGKAVNNKNGKADEKAKVKQDNQQGKNNKGKAKQQNNNGQQEKAKDKKDEKKNNSKASSKAGSNGEAKLTMNEWMTLQEDTMFSFGELQCLSELLYKDASQNWLRISSAFYDKTGRKVHPDDIRDKFAELGAML